MVFLRIYLLVGLIAHKAVWEVLKRRRKPAQANADQASLPRQASPSMRPSIPVQIVKAFKVIMLLAIVAQTLLPDILPINAAAFNLRVVGGLLFTIGLVIAISGRLQLGSSWSDIETAQVLREQTIVANGLYRFIRHPIYIGDLLLLLGLELALNSWLVVGVLLLAPPVIWQALREEKMLIATLRGYKVYCAQTKRFIPFVI